MHLTKQHYLLIAGSVLVATVLGVAAVKISQRSSPLVAPDPTPNTGSVTATDSAPNSGWVTVPEHTPIHVTLDQAVTSNENRPGDHFEATVAEPVIIDGQTVIPQGAHAEGLVVDARHSGALMGRARLLLALRSVAVNGQSYTLRTVSIRQVGGNHKKRNLAWIDGGAGGGALIGALVAGGKGALIGGPVGAGAGTTVAYLTGRKDIKLRPETPLTFMLTEPFTINLKS